jgi:anti-sigma B factor antagonist
MLMTATIERLPEATAVVTFSGAIALGTSLKIADSQVRAAIADGVTRLVFDLTAVDNLDSAGLGMIVYTYGALREKSGTLRLCGVAPRVESLLKLTKTDTYLAIDPSREESLAALKLYLPPATPFSTRPQSRASWFPLPHFSMSRASLSASKLRAGFRSADLPTR